MIMCRYPKYATGKIGDGNSGHILRKKNYLNSTAK